MKRARDWQFELPLTSEEELRLFVEKAWGVRIPDKQVCPNHTTPWRAFADAYFGQSSVTVWEASRGFGGKSFLLALLGLTEAVTLKAGVNILGGSGEQSENVHKYMQDFWEAPGAPRYLLASDPSKRETKLAWGNGIKALMASQRSVRGPHKPRLRLDEIDEMDLAIFDAAMGQTMAQDGIAAQTVASSTHQYADGTMTEVLRRAAEKGWPVYSWCYRESLQPHGWLALEEVERKRGEVTAAMWATEYELQEPSPESRAIQPEAVAATFKKTLGILEGRNGEYIEVEGPRWVCPRCKREQGDARDCPNCGAKTERARYKTGADWARKKDWTVIVTFRTDVDPMRLVAFERLGRRPWPAMVERLDKRLERYGGAAAHDGTGLGDVVDGYLTQSAQAVIMIGRTRSDLLSEYIASLERGEIEAPFIKFMEAEHRYASVEDVYGAGQGAHLPDSIAAGALALKAKRRFYFA